MSFRVRLTLVAGAAVALAIVQATDSNNVGPVLKDNVRDQIDGIRSLIREHSR